MKRGMALFLSLILICVLGVSAEAHDMDNVILEKDGTVLFFGTVLKYDRYFEEKFVAVYEDSDEKIVTADCIYSGYIEVEVKTVFKGDVNFMDRFLETVTMRYEYTDENGSVVYGPELYDVSYSIGTVEVDEDGRTIVKTKSVNDFAPYGMRVGKTYLFAFYGNLTGLETTSEDPYTLEIINAGIFESIEKNLHEGRYEIAEQERLDKLYMATAFTETSTEQTDTTEMMEKQSAEPPSSKESVTTESLPPEIIPEENPNENSNEKETLPYELIETVETVNTEFLELESDGAGKRISDDYIYIAVGSAVLVIVAACAVLLLKKK